MCGALHAHGLRCMALRKCCFRCRGHMRLPGRLSFMLTSPITRPFVSQNLLLRKLAAVRGLVNSQLRSRLWPRLLGSQDAASSAPPALPEGYNVVAEEAHRDSSTVRCDVERSLWSFTEGWSSEERDAKRTELSRLLNALVVSSEGGWLKGG